MSDLSGMLAAPPIGTAMCRQFVADGYRVVANCHESDQERSEAVIAKLSNEGLDVSLSVFDVTDPVACAAAVERIEAQIGELAVVVNAAGITRNAAQP